MMLAAQRSLGVVSLVAADDVAATRAANRELTRTLDEPDVRVGGIRSVSIPGPGGVIPGRH